MTAKKRWPSLAKDIKSTLKYELGIVAIHSTSPSQKLFVMAQPEIGSFRDWQLPLHQSVTSVDVPVIYPALFEFRVKLLTLSFICRVIKVNLFCENQSVLINNMELPHKQPVTYVPSLRLKTKLSSLNCEFKQAPCSEYLPVAFNRSTHSVPVLKTPRVTARQRLILQIPIKREPMDWDLFSREQTYLFWRKLAEKHKISLDSAILWGVYPQVPLNLIVKLWIDDDKVLNMYLMQQAIKPKMAYLVVGRLKKEERLIQTAVTSAQLSKV